MSEKLKLKKLVITGCTGTSKTTGKDYVYSNVSLRDENDLELYAYKDFKLKNIDGFRFEIVLNDANIKYLLENNNFEGVFIPYNERFILYHLINK